MLVAFIHGVATKDVQYADKLKGFIKEEFNKSDIEQINQDFC